MATGTRFALVLVLGLAFLAHEAVADGTKDTKGAKIPEIKMDLRSPGAPAHVFKKGTSDTSSTAPDGLPGWLAAIPDSMRATVTVTDSETYVRVHVDKVGNSITLSIAGPSGLVRGATLPPS